MSGSRERWEFPGPLCCVAVLAVASLGEAASTADWRQRLASEDALGVIRTLCALAKAGPAAREAEDAVAELLTETARGKILSRWCYYALTRISENPKKYRGGYMDAAGWLWYHVVSVGEVGVIDGPRPDMKGPEIPGELGEASRRAWVEGVDAAIQVLRSADERARRRAGEVLEKMGAPEDVMVPRLVDILLDRAAPPGARREAARLVGRYGHSAEAVEPLLLGLKDDDPAVRAACAASMGRLSYPYDFYGGFRGAPGHPEPEKAAAALVEALKDENAEVRKGAATGLQMMRHQAGAAVGPLVELVRAEPHVWTRCSAMYALGQISRGLCKTDPWAFAEAAREAVPALIEVLRLEPTRKTRVLVRKAATTLGQFGDAASAAVPELHRVLRNATGNVEGQILQMMVIQSLGNMGAASAEAVPKIVACAREKREPRADRRYVAAIALGKIGHGGEDVEELLLGLTCAEKYWIRREAARALGIVARESQEVLNALESLLDDEDDDVRKESAEAIEAIRAREVEATF